MNILITGAGGYVGSHLVSKLVEDSSSIVFPVYRYSNQLMQRSSTLHPIIADLSSLDFIRYFPENIDVVVHLAQSKEYRNFPEEVEDIFAVNIRSTQTLLEWSRKYQIKKFIFSSTGNVYKSQNKLLIESDVCEPVGYYGASKYVAEQLIKPYADFFQVSILRLFGVYGAGQKNMIIPHIIDKVLNGKEITLASGEGLIFTPLYINDCVEILQKTIANNKSKYELFNVSGNEIVNLSNLVRIISRLLKVPPIVKITNSKAMYLTADSSLLYKSINYTPSYNFEMGLNRIIEYEKK